jgi:hypothetical protein
MLPLLRPAAGTDSDGKRGNGDMTYDRLAELDRQALRTVEAYCRMTQEATMTKASRT